MLVTQRYDECALISAANAVIYYEIIPSYNLNSPLHEYFVDEGSCRYGACNKSTHMYHYYGLDRQDITFDEAEDYLQEGYPIEVIANFPTTSWHSMLMILRNNCYELYNYPEVGLYCSQKFPRLNVNNFPANLSWSVILKE